MTLHTIIKPSSVINFIDDKKIFSKGENSFESGHVVCFNYIYIYTYLLQSSWSKKSTKYSEDIQTIDELYPNDL